MLSVRLLRKLKDSGTLLIWLLIARACQTVCVAGGGRRWKARAGYALRRARRWEQAAHHYLAAIRSVSGAARPDTFDRSPRVPDLARPSWYYNLGVCLRRSGDLEGALESLREAIKRYPSNPQWFNTLAQTEEQARNLPAAITAQEQAVAIGGSIDPALCLRLASLYDQVGQWSRAQSILTENVRLHPGHGPSYKLLSDVHDQLVRWGGTFGTAEGEEITDAFTFGHSAVEGGPVGSATGQSPVTAALQQAVKLENARPTWRAELADALVRDGDLRTAIKHYATALRQAEASTGRWVLGAKQRWQFRLERTYHRLGEARVKDPLFDCEVQPSEPAMAGTKQVVGFFQARFTHVGMTVSGFAIPGDHDYVEIILNGAPVRSLNLSTDSYFPKFSLPIKRKTLALFPGEGELEVRLATGEALLGPGGAERMRVCIPHGNGRLLPILAEGGKVDKKGVVSPSAEETRLRQERYLEIYSRVRDFFDSEFGRPVFLMYGTLLGYYRDGDFIPGDDDFDAGYVSERNDPISVKAETADIIVKLVRAGFTVSFNRRGRLFRVQLDRGATDGFHIDLRPLWFQDGNLWVHNHVRLPLAREDFLPVSEGVLRGVPVAVPRNTEAFLRGHYGPGWKVPDPGFTYYASEVDRSVRQNLNQALITVAEYKKLASRIKREVGDSAAAGRFVSIGSQDLYPLEEFIS